MIHKIVFSTTMPVREDCWQCYHPQAYHWTAVMVLRLAEVKLLDSAVVIAQMINVVAGASTLAFCLLALLNLKGVGDTVRLVVFALIALNPRLIAINAKATNDSFAILFGSMTIYLLWWAFARRRAWQLLAAGVCVTLMALPKGSGLAMFVLFVFVCTARVVGRMMDGEPVRKQIAAILSVVVLFLIGVSTLAPYGDDYRKHGSPFVANIPKPTPPGFWEDRYSDMRPGVTSVVGGFLTFRLIDMLRTPWITNDKDVYPLHRTSRDGA